MKKMLKKKNQECEIIYAEPLRQMFSSVVFSKVSQAPSVLFVTTQPFYEIYYDKLINLLDKTQTFEWYICPNNESISSLKTFQEVLEFIEKRYLPVGTVIIGAGNNHIYHLCAFLKKTSFYLDCFMYFATTLKGFSEALNGQAYLNNKHASSIVTREYVLPDMLLHDKLLYDLESIDSHLLDFQALLSLGATSDVDLFDSLNSLSFKKKELNLAPYIEKIIHIEKNNSQDLPIYLSAFTKGFYHLIESHYLNSIQKEQITFLLYFLWCIKKNSIDFDFKRFFIWFKNISVCDLRIPQKMNTYELAEGIIKELTKFKQIEGIDRIGSSKLVTPPNLEELYQVIEIFRKIEVE